ncbi:kunitz-type conkunitzin-B1-like [Saccoglossus kowalevskii]|uniref:Conkunitzin-B1-like n=1 Tax=Saccoglossus kowalevskii TaxID=10224 RepID=A0ABM0LTU6_SACKO|nr:PREDICTED: conkunitzin-B1-like [Saccoglossus kowalevskii]
MNRLSVCVLLLIMVVGMAAASYNRNRPQKCGPSVDRGYQCHAHQRYVYGWSKNENDCVRFRYRGCGGNNNQYKRRQACIKKCGVVPIREAKEAPITTTTTQPTHLKPAMMDPEQKSKQRKKSNKGRRLHTGRLIKPKRRSKVKPRRGRH